MKVSLSDAWKAVMPFLNSFLVPNSLMLVVTLLQHVVLVDSVFNTVPRVKCTGARAFQCGAEPCWLTHPMPAHLAHTQVPSSLCHHLLARLFWVFSVLLFCLHSLSWCLHLSPFVTKPRIFLLNFHWWSQIFNLEAFEQHYQGKVLLKQSLEKIFFSSPTSSLLMYVL